MRQPFKHIDAVERDLVHRHLNEDCKLAEMTRSALLRRLKYPSRKLNLPLFGVSQGRAIMLRFFLLRQTPFFRPRGGPRTSSD